MPRLTSIRFPDDLAAQIETSRGRESFHAHVLALCEMALRSSPAPQRKASTPPKPKPAAATTSARAFRPDPKPIRKR